MGSSLFLTFKINSNKLLEWVKSSSNLYIITFIYVILAVYILPYGFPHGKYILPIILLLYFLYTIVSEEEHSMLDILLFFLLLASIFIFGFSLDKLKLVVILFMVFIVARKPISIPDRVASVLYIFAFLFLIYQFSVCRHKSRIVLSILDPNFSGLLMLLFFFYCQKLNYKLGTILSLISIFFLLSRNYLLAILVFYMVSFLKKRLKLLKISRFGVLLLTLNILIMFLSIYWVYNVNYGIHETNDITRMFNIVDTSNYWRFTANYRIYNAFKDELMLALKGFDEGLEVLFHPVPHNSFIYLIGQYGLLYSFFYLWILSRIINRYFYYNNYEYIMSYLVFSLFLHGLFDSILLLLFVLILVLKKEDEDIVSSELMVIAK